MRKVYENEELRKIELERNDDGFANTKFRMEAFIGKQINTATISFDEIKREFTSYSNSKDDIERLGLHIGDCSDCILIGIKYNILTRQIRFKKYYLGNYLNVKTNDIIFHTGICSMTGEYTLYIFENQEPDDVRHGFHKQSKENYYGLTYSKDGRFIRKSEYKHETSIL